MSGLRVTFVVQGEGRGHMTQALALAGFLREAGHEVVRVLVGRSPHRSLPRYFVDDIGAPVESFEAPVQVPGRDRRAVSAWATAGDAARRLPAFVRSGFRIHDAARSADVVVNFLDLVGGMSRLVLRTPVPCLAVAHNYLFLHPDLSDPPGNRLAHRIVMGWTRATAARSRIRLALGFEPARAVADLRVAPPLLRPLAPPAGDAGDYLLAYALNPGYGDELVRWQRRRGDVAVVCYLDGGRRALRESPGDGFTVRDLDQEGFLAALAGCRAYVGSAGFESVCEALLLGKPVLAVPTGGQHEQRLNAWDAERCGAARAGGYGDLDDFWDHAAPPPPSRVAAFRAWVARAPEIHVGALEEAASSARTRPAVATDLPPRRRGG